MALVFRSYPGVFGCYKTCFALPPSPLVRHVCVAKHEIGDFRLRCRGCLVSPILKWIYAGRSTRLMLSSFIDPEWEILKSTNTGLVGWQSRRFLGSGYAFLHMTTELFVMVKRIIYLWMMKMKKTVRGDRQQPASRRMAISNDYKSNQNIKPSN